MNIRTATETDIPTIKKIANQFKTELGYVMYPVLRDGIARGELLAAVADNTVVGFILYYTRRDGWHTIREIAVHRDYQRRGIGRQLFERVPAPVRLKCVHGTPANDFYEAMGLYWVRFEPGKKRGLNVWQTVESWT